MRKLFTKLRKLHANTDGSDSIEMIGAVAMLCVFILIGITLLSYVIETNLVNMAVRQVARNIETSGIADSSKANAQFAKYVGNKKNIEIPANGGVKLSTSGKIQLTDTFRVEASCYYKIPLINPGNFTGYTIKLPIKVTSMGMSEVYWSGF